MASNIAIQITANTQQAVAGIQSVNQKLDQMQKASESVSAKFQRLTSIIGGATISFGAVAKAFQTVASAVSACTTAYSAQELAERKLQTTLIATQNAVGMTAGEMLDLADALSSVTTYSDQEIIAVEQMLAATRKISAEVMPEATQAVLDMAAATGDDAAGAAKDLAQALSDPAGEIESLKEKGIQLTAEQAENIRKVQEQNGLYEAQKLLLKEVAGTYGGMAKSIADTDTGKLQQISNVWTDIKEGLGEGLLNAIGPALDDLYGKLLAIKEWIDNYNAQTVINAEAFDYMNGVLGGGAIANIEGLDDSVLRAILGMSNYSKWSENYDSMNGAPTDAFETLDKWRVELRELMKGVGSAFTAEDRDLVQAINAELRRRSRERMRSITGTMQAVGIQGFGEGIDIFGQGGNPLAMMYGASAPQIEQQHLDSRISAFIDENGSLSASAQIDAINEKLEESRNLMQGLDPDSERYKYLEEINEGLERQKREIEETRDAAEEADNETTKWFKDLVAQFPTIVDTFNQLTTSISDIFSNMANSAEDELQRIEDKWDEYFEELDRKQERQADSLNAFLTSGNISYEDYIDAMNDMDKTREEAQEEAQAEEEEQRQKANELGKAAFEANRANQVAQVIMDTASAIMGAWANDPTPWVAGLTTALITATAATQMAAISSQQYTPLAAGGIVTAPTRALIGEGGSPEAILPLNEGNMDRFGLGGNPSGTITVNISIGAVYSKEHLADEIFKGIERAQRTGALPKWRYA